MTIRYSATYLRTCIWRSFHINSKRSALSAVDLVGYIEGISRSTAQKALRHLEAHGYIEKVAGGAGGQPQRYVRARQNLLLPAVCEVCGLQFHEKCDPLKREREREKERAAVWHKVPVDLKERLERQWNGEQAGEP